MNWTKDKPTKDGNYFMRDDWTGPNPTVISFSGGVIHSMNTTSNKVFQTYLCQIDKTTEWLGPFTAEDLIK